MESIYSEGYLEVAIGPMFSGKTSWLLEIFSQHTFCDKNVTVINHSEDNRYHEDMLSTHDKKMIPCIKTHTFVKDDTNKEIFDKSLSSDVVLINEGQFFEGLYDFVMLLLENKKIVYVSGLDGDFNRNKFGELIDLIPMCDKVHKLRSLCGICKNGTRAIFSKRLIESKEQKVIGNDIYVPVCRKCYNSQDMPYTCKVV